jgi:hypothetical protein
MVFVESPRYFFGDLCRDVRVGVDELDEFNPVEASCGDRAGGGHVGRTGSARENRELADQVARAELTEDDALRAFDDGRSRHENQYVVGGITVPDQKLSLTERDTGRGRGGTIQDASQGDSHGRAR